MVKWTIKLGAAELNRVLTGAFPGGDAAGEQVQEVSPGYARVVRAFHPAMLRPGDLVSGPTLMAVADMAAYVLVMAHVGPELMAVTSSLTIHFLRGAARGDITGEARLLSLGRRLAVSDVRLWTESPERLAAHATVTYARAAAG
jgi:uncharacterized protein (TIGR00369 family)